MDNRQPLVSVILPTKNRAHLVTEAIEGVLGQTYSNLELIVVLDNCSDNSEEIVLENIRKDSRIRRFKGVYGSCAIARNYGMTHARGKYICFLDDDDVWEMGKLELQVAVMEKHERVGLCLTEGYMFQGEQTIKTGLVPRANPCMKSWMNENRTDDDSVYTGNLYKVLVHVNPVVVSSSMVRKTAISSVNYFDESLHGCEGYDLWIRMSERFHAAFIDKSLVRYRMNEVSYMGPMDARAYSTRRFDSIVLEKHYKRVPDQLKNAVRQRIVNTSKVAGWYYLNSKDFQRSRELLYRSLRFNWLQPKVWMYLFLSYIKNVFSEKKVKPSLDKSSISARTLFLASSLPYPANSGGQMRTLNILKYLSQKSHVTMICPGDESKDQAKVSKLSVYASQIELISSDVFGPYSKQNKKWSLKQRISKMFNREPWILQDFLAEEFRESLLSKDLDSFNVIVIRYPLLSYYFFNDKHLQKYLPKVVIDVDDVLVQMQERRVMAMPFGYAKLRHWMEALFLRSYYKKLKKVQGCWVTSVKDKEYMEKRGYSKKVSIVPNTIEITDNSEKNIPAEAGRQILFCGSLSFSHNTEAVMYFVEKVFPRIQKEIKDVEFVIIGKNPTEEIQALDSRQGISVHGNVPSTKEYYRKASLVVVPMLNGAGTKIKVLEAMVYHRAVVSTTVGAEGLALTHGINTMIANDPYSFARACADLLRDPAKRAFIAENAFRFVRENYSLENAFRSMDKTLNRFYEGYKPKQILLQDEVEKETPISGGVTCN